jgi:hypothetical protein
VLAREPCQVSEQTMEGLGACRRFRLNHESLISREADQSGVSCGTALIGEVPILASPDGNWTVRASGSEGQ